MARLAFVCLTILSAVAAVFAAPANTEGTLYMDATFLQVQAMHAVKE